MTASLRNSIHRRNHKERSQLAHRSRLGILEKHADYVKRARDYHSKQDRLTRLRQKAADKNKDEFYFSMTKEKTKGGVHIKDRGNTALPVDIVKVLKTQDENYVRTMRSANQKKMDNIKIQLTSLVDLVKPFTEEDTEDLDTDELDILSNAGIIPRKSKGKSPQRKAKPGHIVFVDTLEDARQYAASGSSSALTVPKADTAPSTSDADLGWKVPQAKRSKKRKSDAFAADVEMSPPVVASEASESATQHRGRLLKELSARLSRDTQLRYAEREFEMQRLLMGKGGRKKIRGPEKVEGGGDTDEEDEDEIDSRKGKRTVKPVQVTEETYKPRVYKWRMERKR